MQTLTLQVFAQGGGSTQPQLRQDQTVLKALDIKYSKDFIQRHFRSDQFACLRIILQIFT